MLAPVLLSTHSAKMETWYYSVIFFILISLRIAHREKGGGRASKQDIYGLKSVTVSFTYFVNISAHQNQTDLRFSTWLLLGSRVCNVTFVWTTMIPLINFFINAVPIPIASLTVATIATCAPESITAELTFTTYLKKQADLYLQWRELDRDFASISVPFCASN